MGTGMPKPSADQYKLRRPIAPTENPFERPVLVHSSCYRKKKKMPTEQVAYKQQKFITPCSRGLKSKTRVLARQESGESSLPNCRPPMSHYILTGQ